MMKETPADLSKCAQDVYGDKSACELRPIATSAVKTSLHSHCDDCRLVRRINASGSSSVRTALLLLRHAVKVAHPWIV